MKNLKFRLFSLLAIFAVSVFLTSCEQETVVEAINEDTLTDAIVHFTLPESIDNMSDEELAIFFAEKTEDEILEIAEILPNDRLEERWCTTPVTFGSACTYVGPPCNHHHRQKLYKRYYCDGYGWIYYFSWGSCCLP